MRQKEMTLLYSEEEDGEVIYLTQIEGEEEDGLIDEICMDRQTAIELALQILNSLAL